MVRFMVQLSTEPTYFTDVREGKVYETIHPTYGRQMSFGAANELISRLRTLGFESATAVDQYGTIPSTADLQTAKSSAECVVTFSGRFFMQNPSGVDCGTTDREQAAVMSRAAANEVILRLKRKHHKDVAIAEVHPTLNIAEELARIWPEEFANNSSKTEA